MSTLQMDIGNIARAVYDVPTSAYKVLPVGGTLVPDHYDSITLTYITSGNGVGQVGTVVYNLSGGTVATLTLTYDSSGRVITVTRS